MADAIDVEETEAKIATLMTVVERFERAALAASAAKPEHCDRDAAAMAVCYARQYLNELLPVVHEYASTDPP